MKKQDINIGIATEIATLAFEKLKKNHISLRKEFPTLDCQQFKYENYISYLKIWSKGNKIAVLFEISDTEKFKNEFFRITQKNFFKWVKNDLARIIEREYSVEAFIGNDAEHNDLLEAAEVMENFKTPIVIHRIKIDTNKKVKVL